MDVSQMSDGLVRISKDEQTYLGIVTYLKSNNFAVTRLTSQKRSNGYIVRDDRIETWQPSGFTEHGGRVLLYGPQQEGRTLSEILTVESENTLPYLSRLARALEQLKNNDIAAPLMHTRAIVFLSDGALFFLPREIMWTITTHQSLEDRMEFHDLFNHPDLSAEQNCSFALAVLLYYSLTGEYPFTADSDDELRNLMRNQVVTKPIYLVPEVRADISDFLTSIFESPRTNVPPMSEWVGRFHSWIQEGTHRDIDEEQRLDIVAKATTAREQKEKSYRRREFFRKNRVRIAIIALIVVVVGTIPGTMIYRSLQPRSIAGLPPAEVVKTFYQSVNEFDHMTMEDATVDGAGGDLVREVTNLYVMSRMRMSVELQSGFINAEKWRREGMPEIAADQTVYGIANLTVQPGNASGENQRVFLAEYEKWQPEVNRSGEIPDPTERQSRVIGFTRVDRLHLRRDRDSWVIYRLERLEENEIDRAALTS